MFSFGTFARNSVYLIALLAHFVQIRSPPQIAPQRAFAYAVHGGELTGLELTLDHVLRPALAVTTWPSA